MPLDTSASLPAKIGSGEIATNIEVDTSIADAIDPLASMDWVTNYSSGFLVNEDFGPVGTTSIDGGRITAGTSINAPVINGGEINSNIMNSGVMNGGVINAATINGATITGAVIKGSWIDSLDSGILTFWQHFGTIGNSHGYPEVPQEYQHNFAHDNSTGEIIVDSEGYVRLPATSKIYTTGLPSIYQSVEADHGSGFTYSGRTLSSPSYDEYMTNNAQRPMTANPRVYSSGGQVLEIIMFAENNDSNTMYTNTFIIKIHTNIIEVYVCLREAKGTITVVHNGITQLSLTNSEGTHTSTINMSSDGMPVRITYEQNTMEIPEDVYIAPINDGRSGGGMRLRVTIPGQEYYDLTNYTTANAPLFSINDVVFTRANDNDSGASITTSFPDFRNYANE